jgi:hypothetical protein
MQFDRDKFKALVLYIIWRTSHTSGFGSTKLNKALWFAEARSFEAHGKQITGETFIRDRFGPRSRHLRAICLELEDQGFIEPFLEPVHDRNASRYRALSPGDTSRFSPEELAMIDWWISHISNDHTAVSISDLSHDYGWEVAAMGEPLPVQAILAKRIRQLESEDERAWAVDEIKRLSLK